MAHEDDSRLEYIRTRTEVVNLLNESQTEITETSPSSFAAYGERPAVAPKIWTRRPSQSAFDECGNLYEILFNAYGTTHIRHEHGYALKLEEKKPVKQSRMREMVYGKLSECQISKKNEGERPAWG